MYYEDAIKLLTNYYNILRNNFSPHWDDYQIQVYSYRESAVMEIINRIMDCPFEDATDVVNSYILNIEFMRKLVGTPKSRLIFSTCLKTGRDIKFLIKETKSNEN